MEVAGAVVVELVGVEGEEREGGLEAGTEYDFVCVWREVGEALYFVD